MATINATLQTWKADKNGRHLLLLRIEAGNRTRYVSLGIKVRKSQWNRKRQEVRSGYPFTTTFNAIVQKDLRRARDLLNR
ncbi:MAG: Arm DNA-binding domain-containing protein, partial [Bacteroidetes bacterium]|nr:Arm DNA-binding domain-containing protein [Bacteroidota bacterium]